MLSDKADNESDPNIADQRRKRVISNWKCGFDQCWQVMKANWQFLSSLHMDRELMSWTSFECLNALNFNADSISIGIIHFLA